MTDTRRRGWPVRRALLVGCPIALVAGVALLYKLVVALTGLPDTVRDSYAQWRVADMVVQYLEWNDGNWPRCWEDLDEARHVIASNWPFEDLRARVEIDFAADPEALTNADPPVRVIRLVNGKRHHWSGAEPNEIIRQYLRDRSRHPPGHAYPKRPDAREQAARTALTALRCSWKLDADGHVTEVVADSDTALAHLSELPEVRGLNLGYSPVTDAGLATAGDLSRLRWIYLYGTRVTDAGLAHLRGAHQLQSLVLASPNFTDAAIDHVVGHESLKLLNLNGTRVTDAGIARLHQLAGLQEVMLGETKVTPEGVRALRRALPRCKVD